ncbi:Creatinine amidohydrolase [compost metagenome]
MMLHYYPHLVALDQIPDHGPAQFPVYDMYPTRTEWVPDSGVLSSARGSSADKGKWLVEDVIGGIVQAVRFEFGLES